jgi:hypothetical protein
VCAVGDGAAWCQRFYDWHCPDAVRILDWAHAVEYVAAAAHATWGAGTAPAATWLEATRTALATGTPADVLARLRALAEPGAAAPPAEAVTEALRYLEAREAQIAYAAFRAAGYPIGSGIVESANKLVVEARLKGSGMHWARANVNPMVALRAACCSDRWAEAWDQLTAQRRAARTSTRQARQAARAAARPVPPPPAAPEAPPAPAPTRPPRPRLIENGRPTEHHPWRTGLQARAS